MYRLLEKNDLDEANKSIQQLPDTFQGEHAKSLFQGIIDYRMGNFNSVHENIGLLYKSCCQKSNRYYCLLIKLEYDFVLLRLDKITINEEIFSRFKKYETQISKFEISQKTDVLAKIYRNMSYIYFRLQKYKQAIDKMEIAIKHSREIEDKLQVGYMYNMIGIMFDRMGDLKSALEEFEKSNKIFKTIDAQRGIFITNSNIADIHIQTGQLSKAEEVHLQGIKYFDDIGEKKNVAASYYSVANLYRLMGEYSKALENFEAGLIIFSNLKDFRQEGIGLMYIGLIHRSMNKIDQSLAYFHEAHKRFNNNNLPVDDSVVLFHLYETYIQLNDQNKINEYLDKMQKNLKLVYDPQSSVRLNFAKALKIKKESRLVVKFTAMPILKEILSNEISDLSLHISVLLEYADLLLLEYKLLYNEEIFNEIMELNQRLIDIVEITNSPLIKIELLILAAKIDFTFENINDSLISLTKAKELVMDNFPLYKQKIDDLWENIENFISKNQDYLIASKPIIDKIQVESLSNYLMDVAKIIKEVKDFNT
jgi:tetratricopeptide (TPR) repeat protein